MGDIQTTVGILFSFNICNVSNLSFVEHTLGSIHLHSLSSYVVKVICMMHLDLLLILFKMSKSLDTRLDFVCNVIPNSYLSIICKHLRVIFKYSSHYIYESDIYPVPIMHFFRLLRNDCSNSLVAIVFTSTSS